MEDFEPLGGGDKDILDYPKLNYTTLSSLPTNILHSTSTESNDDQEDVENEGPGSSCSTLCVSCADDASIVAIGCSDGRFFLCEAASMECIFSSDDAGGPVVILEVLAGSSLAALVVATPCFRANQPSDTTPGKELSYTNRDVQLWDFNVGSRAAVLRLPSSTAASHSDHSKLMKNLFWNYNGEIHPVNVRNISEVNSSSQRSLLFVGKPRFSSGQYACCEPIVAVKFNRRRLVVFLDCPSAEINIFELMTLRLLHRLERSVACVAAPVPLTINKYDLLLPSMPTQSLAAVGATCAARSLLAVPIGVAAVDLNSKEALRRASDKTTALDHPSFPVACEEAVAAAALKGRYDGCADIGILALIDLLGEVRAIGWTRTATHPISAVAMNPAGTLIATASVKVNPC